MNKITYNIEIPLNCRDMQAIEWPFTLDQIRRLAEQAQSLLEQADKPQPREWRLWDMVQLQLVCANAVLLRCNGSTHPWVAITQRTGWTDEEVVAHKHTYLGNLADILAQGTVLVGLTEERVQHLLRKLGWQGCPKCGAIRDQVNAALAERKEKP